MTTRSHALLPALLTAILLTAAACSPAAPAVAEDTTVPAVAATAPAVSMEPAVPAAHDGGSVVAEALPPEAPWAHLDETTGELRIDLWYGYTESCPNCQAAKPYLEQLEAELPWLVIHRLSFDTDRDATVERLTELADLLGEPVPPYVPVFVFAERLDMGYDESSLSGELLRARLIEYRDSLLAELPPAPVEIEPAPGLPFDPEAADCDDEAEEVCLPGAAD